MKKLLALLAMFFCFILSSFALSMLFYDDVGYIESLLIAFKGFIFININLLLLVFAICLVNDYKQVIRKVFNFFNNLFEIPLLFIVAFFTEIIAFVVFILLYMLIIYAFSELLDIVFYKVLLASIVILIALLSCICFKFVKYMLPEE